MFVNRWIETHASIRPSKVAIRHPLGQVTYAELHHSSLKMTYKLHALGVRPGDRVAIYAANCPEWFETFLGCGHLGACLVPLNWRLSAEEVDQIVEDCQPKVTIIDPSMSCPVAGVSLQELAKMPAEKVDLPQVLPDTPLALYYTGGTTGVPKGAVLTHNSIQWNAWNTISGWGLAPTDIFPVFTPLFHTGGLNVMATPLLCLGGTIVLPGPFKVDGALELIQTEACTAVFMVPTMYEMVRSAPNFSAAIFKNVRLLISGGAPCPQSLFEAYWSLGLPLVQGYGLTEAGPNTFGVSPEEAKRKLGTVGSPLPGVQVRLVKEDGHLCLAGETGELQVHGGHVMAGYFGRSQETAKVLQDGWLSTGDLAYRDLDGFYFICGRRKEMYISGGENVFPSEVEQALLTHPEVAEAAVIGVPHPKWGEVGRAYLVLKTSNSVNARQMTAHCELHLAKYKLPKEYVMLEELPKSAAGKVLKRLLPQTEAVTAWEGEDIDDLRQGLTKETQ